MTRFAGISPTFLVSRSVLVVFGVQIAFLITALTAPIHGVQFLMGPVFVEAQFINFFTDYLFAPGYNGLWDPLATLLVLPFVYYVTAIAIAGLGRTAYRLGEGRSG